MTTLERLRRNKKIRYIDTDEPGVYIVTLNYGNSFEYRSHEGVRGFDTIVEIRGSINDTYPCQCSECKEGAS